MFNFIKKLFKKEEAVDFCDDYPAKKFMEELEQISRRDRKTGRFLSGNNWGHLNKGKKHKKHKKR